MTRLFLEPHQLRRVNREFVNYVKEHFPMRFYRSHPRWRLCAAAALLRMCDTVDTIMIMMGRRKLLDAQTLLRSLYEQVVVFASVAIDPESRLAQWEGQSKIEQLKIHNEALAYGQTILTPAEVTDFKSARGLPRTEAMARELDHYWPDRIAGVQPAGHLLSFHGLYQGIYRTGSRPTHGAFAALDSYVQLAQRQNRAASVVVETTQHTMLTYSLAAPLLGIALFIAGRAFPWLDDAKVTHFVDRATAETARRRGEVPAASHKRQWTYA